MTDAVLTKLCEKKLHEACAKLPKERKRVLAAMLATVLDALRVDDLCDDAMNLLLTRLIDEGLMPRPAALQGVEFRGEKQ